MAAVKRIFTDEFKSGLQLLSMRDEVGASEGLKFPDDKNLSPYEILHFIESEDYEPTAIFFRRFDNNRPPIPAAYIYDFTSDKKSDDELKDLYKKLWNSCKVPFFIVFDKEEVRIFNLYDKSVKDIDKKLTPYEIIKIAAGAESEFNARNILTGSLWESGKGAKEIKKGYGAYESFLAALRGLRKVIRNKAGLKPEIADSLLVKFIFIKYLEERKVLKDGYWKKFSKDAAEFLDTFANNQSVIDVLDDLGSHFNGGIFRLEKHEREEILKSDLTEFSMFLRGDLEGDQLTLWKIYFFEDLPVELISNIYEDFLDNKSGGIVYTPPLLVNFMIDEVMPLDKPKENFSVFDPACGSGIFLVAAYKRMIQWWMLKNDWKRPGVRELKKILKHSVFGTDIHEEASQLAIFSLSLAICDVLSPKAIWSELKFDDLSRENILSKDFFEIVQRDEFCCRFDLVIGNPPFEAKLTPAALEIEKIEQRERVKLPDKQIALLFLEQGFKLCKKNGYISFVQPAGPLLYNQQSYEFRKYFFNSIAVREIIDFSCLRSTLFKGRAKVATAVIICENNKPDNQEILHITVRDSYTSKEKIFFEIDKYDFHYVKYEDALNESFIWKSNLLGGGRIKYIIQRFSNMKTIGQYLKEMVKKNGWLYQEGFNKASNSSEGNIRADYLYRSNYLKPEALDINGIDHNQIEILQYKYFEAPRPERLYKAPMLIIREIFRKDGIPIAFVDRDISFSKQLIGIKSDVENELKRIFKIIHKNTLVCFIVLIKSGRLIISHHPSLLKADIDNIPLLNKEEDYNLTEIEEIIINDTLEYMTDYCQGLLYASIFKNVNPKQLSDFGKVYCDLLNSVYKKFISHDPVIAGQFICYPFSYGDVPFSLGEDTDLEKYLIELVHKKYNENILIKRNVRVYDDKLILLIKPKQLRYWMKSIAVRDADETFSDLIEMGY